MVDNTAEVVRALLEAAKRGEAYAATANPPAIWIVPEKEAVVEPTIGSNLEELQRYLVVEAHHALNLPDFGLRNTAMARAVAKESSILAARSIGREDAQRGLEQMFEFACGEAGRVFEPVFTSDGQPRTEMVDQYKKALDYAGIVALTWLPGLFEVTGLK